jgi:F0F1-type ATP synthase assembly protein I
MVHKSSQRSLQITGWLLFIASALCFTASTFNSGDVLGLGGSLLFLIACFVFLWPLVSDR